ncbi:MAG: hypothetical protein ACKO1M_05610 [Planctomycetota bacterium]
MEGLSFHVGSQCTNPENYVQALNLCAGIFNEAKLRGFELKLLDIGGGFPAAYDASVPKFATLAKKINTRSTDCFRSRSRSWPSRAGSSWPRPAPPSPRSSARPTATGSGRTTSTTASTTPSRA